MDENQKESELSEAVKLACAIARGEIEGPDESSYDEVGASKNLNSKGRGPIWYRIVWRMGKWQYVSLDRLPNGSFRAAERRATVYGPVWIGEVLVTHDKGRPIDKDGLLVVGKGHALKVEVKTTRNGLRIVLPDGTSIDRPNPRS